MSRLVVWCHEEHANSPLAAVRPPSFIIDDGGITTISKLHPENITDYRQITDLLDQTVEWEEEWSKKVFEVILQFDRDLARLRQTAATQKKSQQKRTRVDKDRISFEEATKENEERIRLQVSQWFAAMQRPLTRNVLQTSNIENM